MDRAPEETSRMAIAAWSLQGAGGTLPMVGSVLMVRRAGKNIADQQYTY